MDQSVPEPISQWASQSINIVSVLISAGSPDPELEWVVNGRPVDEAHQTRTGGVVISHVVLKGLARELLKAEVECRAHTAGVSASIVTVATIDMNCKSQNSMPFTIIIIDMNS